MCASTTIACEKASDPGYSISWHNVETTRAHRAERVSFQLMDRQFPDESSRRRIRRQLAAWYAQHARDLPWRRTRDPYAVWVSEIMLQQTQVATVIPYFLRFIGAFPTVQSLAAASEQQVLRLWEGLGYYRRARQIWRAAREIVERHRGEFPSNFDEAISLPGIGRYTAGAILSIAFDARQPVLEANTIRLYSRLAGFRGSTKGSGGQKTLWKIATDLLPASEAGKFNQAAMELGSRVCTPRQPMCDLCPVASDCRAFALGLQHKIPAPDQKTTYEAIREVCVIVRKRGKILLRCCGPEERWAGLWDFPRFTLLPIEHVPLASQLVAGVRKLTGVTIESGSCVTTIKHGVTRFRITLDCYDGSWRSGSVAGPALRWLKPESLEEFPLSMTARKIARLIAGPSQ